MFAQDEWLDKFIQDYKAKLACEKLELLASDQQQTRRRRRTATSQQTSHHVGKLQSGDTFISSLSSEARLTSEVTTPSERQLSPDVTGVTKQSHPEEDLATVVGRDEQRDAAERKKKQGEYHRILDQQLAEHRQKKEQELMKKKLLEADDDVDENASNLNTARSRSVHPRSPSPPIKSHYRNFVQVRVPSRPLTASGNQQRLSDLTELRQLYSNR